MTNRRQWTERKINEGVIIEKEKKKGPRAFCQPAELE